MSISEAQSYNPTEHSQFGSVGYIGVVDIDALHSDDLYQRGLSADIVQKIAETYDMVTAGTIVVSKRPNGELYIVDGQHRTAAALLAGEKQILAQIVEGMSPEDEARLRLQGNYKRPDSTFEAFRARLFANDPVALAMQEIAHEYGTRINMSPDVNLGINAIAAVEKLYTLDNNGTELRKTLGMLKDVFGDVQGQHVSSNLLKAVNWFLSRHSDESDYQHAVQRMRTAGAGHIGRMARNQKAVMGGALWVNFYRAIVELYNEGLRESNRLEWRTNRYTKRLGSDDGGAN